MERQRLKKGEKRPAAWAKLAQELLKNGEVYHQCFYESEIFDGPSHHFHIRVLESSENEKTELIYALLVSWGMHRMGNGGAKMNPYKKFSESIGLAKNRLDSLKNFNIADISDKDFLLLKPVFDMLNPMKTKRKIVAVSKIIAHYLPNLIAPIDNEYTFRFIFGQAGYPKNWMDEFELFMEIHINLYKRVAEDVKFRRLAEKWMKAPKNKWDTSLPKIIDNLIIGKRVYEKELLKMKKYE